ncbi:MAG: HAD family hydrolase [Bacteriovoracaceae bacterium]|nr:HAD family hydrolase [Bacteriovoracaceae bacterium]
MKYIQAIFFDFDGVILESVDIKGWAFGKLFQGYPEHVDQIVAFHHANGGMSRFDKFRHIYKNILQKPLLNEEFKRLCEDFSNLVYHRVLKCDFVPGAMEFLRKYSNKIHLFIISGTPQDEMMKIVNTKGLEKYFRGVFGSPTPKGVWAKRVVNEFHLDSASVVFVGDAMSDYYAAKVNSLFFVARVKDSENDIFEDKKVDAKITDLFELDTLFQKLVLNLKVTQ